MGSTEAAWPDNIRLVSADFREDGTVRVWMEFGIADWSGTKWWNWHIQRGGVGLTLQTAVDEAVETINWHIRDDLLRALKKADERLARHNDSRLQQSRNPQLGTRHLGIRLDSSFIGRYQETGRVGHGQSDSSSAERSPQESEDAGRE